VPTGFTLTVGEHQDPCTHPFGAQFHGQPCYVVEASWDDPGDPVALYNLVPRPSEWTQAIAVATIPIGPTRYPSSDGVMRVTIAVLPDTSVCVELAAYGPGLERGSGFAEACVTTP
jgi:hypothetical protein